LTTDNGSYLQAADHKGQVFLSKAVRAKAKIKPGSVVLVNPVSEGSVVLTIVDDPQVTEQFKNLLEDLERKAAAIVQPRPTEKTPAARKPPRKGSKKNAARSG
jgi:hypothetical protein